MQINGQLLSTFAVGENGLIYWISKCSAISKFVDKLFLVMDDLGGLRVFYGDLRRFSFQEWGDYLPVERSQ